MSQNAFIGTAERSFGAALLHLLESEYGLLGSRRVLDLLVRDVLHLVEQFYPPPERLTRGWMMFVATKASGDKVHPGQYAHQHELVTIAWPVLLDEDLDYLAQHPDTRETRQEMNKKRLVRLIEYGLAHPAGPLLLTEADLAAMLGMLDVQVSRMLRELRQETGKTLMTKGIFFDQGMKPTHKGEVIALYEAGLDECEVARRSGHALKSVGKYIGDYERVKKLLAHHTPQAEIPALLNMLPGVVRAYTEMVVKYHPDLAPQPPGQPGLKVSFVTIPASSSPPEI